MNFTRTLRHNRFSTFLELSLILPSEPSPDLCLDVVSCFGFSSEVLHQLLDLLQTSVGLYKILFNQLNLRVDFKEWKHLNGCGAKVVVSEREDACVSAGF